MEALRCGQVVIDAWSAEESGTSGPYRSHTRFRAVDKPHTTGQCPRAENALETEEVKRVLVTFSLLRTSRSAGDALRAAGSGPAGMRPGL